MNLHPPGTIIAGRYEIVGRPLMGGMGIVYLCLDHGNTKHPVALKTFRPEYLPDRAARDRFLREATTWVNLGAHPHIVRCYNVLHVDPVAFLVLELVAKEHEREDASLRSWLALGKPLPLDQALLFALQIARGLKHATEIIPGFVHRDLKPENVLVGADKLTNANVNRLRATDFGLASALQETSQHISESANGGQLSSVASGRTQLTHGFVGTPLYMAPEQWRGEPVSVATDVYALGCILVEMLTGQRAVEGKSVEALQRAHCTGQVRMLSPSLPESVRELTRHCLTLRSEARWGRWVAVEAALAKAYAQVCGQAAPEPETQQAISRAERVAAGWSYNAIGRAYLNIGKAQVAVGYFEQARMTGVAEEDQKLVEAGLNCLGVAYEDLGDARQALGYHEQALQIDRNLGDRQGQGTALGNLGNVYLQLGDVQRAIAYHEQALAIDRESGNRRRQGNDLGSLGNAYLQLGDARRAIGYYEEMLVIAREIGNKHDEGMVLFNLGGAYQKLGDTQRAFRHYEQYLTMARQIGDRLGEGVSIGNLGDAYLKLGDRQRAIRYLEQALTIVREIGNRSYEGTMLSKLGLAYASDDPRRAVRYFEQSLAIWRETGNLREEGADLGNLGLACMVLGDWQRARGHFQQQLVITRKIGDRKGVGTAQDYLGLAYAYLHDTRQAIECRSQALAIWHELGDINNVARDSFDIARLYAQQGQVAHALPLAQQAVQLYAQIGHTENAQRAQQLVAQLQGGGTVDSGPSSAQILQQFALVIQDAIAATRGNRKARAKLDGALDIFAQKGWHIAEPIRRIWTGERDEVRLTASIDPNSALIIREILKKLKS